MLEDIDGGTFDIPDIPIIYTNLTGNTGPVISANFSSNGDKIVTVSADETAKIWDTELLHTLTNVYLFFLNVIKVIKCH